ncbi:MAG: preprotein translocase subunit SecG [Gammaproteobacteria bacterium]|nr:preprotein translocase subunit SecG [Gammaproteobacteria bacterium]
MQKAVLIGHTLIALMIIVLVLLQRGKGADAGAAFGAGASGTVFGARGSGSFFSRATAVCATAFFVSSLTLAYLSSQRTTAPDSLLEDLPAVEEVVEELPQISTDEATDMPAIETVEEAVDEMPALPESEGEADEGN